jgi:diguanylate cyclase (GGDEF)-like protein
MRDSGRTDTGLGGRQALVDELGAGGGLSPEREQRLSLALCGPDGLARIRADHGDAVAEQILADFAGLLARMSRDLDRVVRWTDDRFMLALPLTRAEGAAKLCERIRREAAFMEFAGTPERVTASFGIAERVAEESLDGLLQRVDDAIGQALRDEGNQVFVALAPTMEMQAIEDP